MRIDWDIEELAGYAMGKTEKEVEAMVNEETIDDEIYQKYDIDFSTYLEIVKDLLPFTPKVQAGISKEFYHAFLDEKNHRMIVRQKAE